MRRETNPVEELSHRFRDLDDLEATPELRAARNGWSVIDASWGHLASMLVELDVVEPDHVMDFLGITIEELRDPSIVITDDPELNCGDPYSVMYGSVYNGLMDAELDETDEIFEQLKLAFVERDWLGAVDEELAAELIKLRNEEGSSDSWLDYEIRAAQSEYKIPLLGFIAVAMKLDDEDGLFNGRAIDIIADWLGSYELEDQLISVDDDAAQDIILDREVLNSFFELINYRKYLHVERVAEQRTRDILDVLKPKPLKELLGAMHHSNPRD